MASRNIIDLKSRNIEESQISASPQSIDPAIVIDNKAINTERALIKDLSEESTRLNKTPPVPSSTKLTTVQTFGSYMNPTTSYPNDVVVLDIQNAVQQYLETKFRVDSYIQKSNKVTLFPEEDLARLSYLSGRYRVTYKFHRNLLGSGDLHKMQIQEISADGLEVRVIPALSSTFDNTDFINFFGGGFFGLPKSQTLVNLFLFKDANTSARVFDYVQDKFTFDTIPYSIIFKLTSPIPSGIVVGDLLWLAQQVSEDITDEITIIPPKYQPRTIPISGPNFDITSRERTQAATQYKDWDDLLTTNTATANDIINKLLSGSLMEGIPLNIDYRNFENYIYFGSAQERLLNFKYKMELLEDYDSRIAALTTDLTGRTNSNSTGSLYYQTNVIEAKTKKAALLGSFDGYEKYLYYESSSYESSSYGEFYPTTWPVRNSKPPYINYSTTSSVVEDWFDGIISSASLYDQNNAKALYKLVPEHILEDPSNEEYILFTHMIGHYYDLMFSYIKQITKTTDRNEDILEGFSKDLIYHVARNLGVDFENGNTLEELWSYTLGTDVTGSLVSPTATTIENKTKEIWKRIINNLPYLLKTKGTERGVRALINCFGIPSTILRIREYGGAEPYFETKNDMVYERFNYSLIVGDGGRPQTTTAFFNQLRIPWQKLNNGYFPMTTELRIKMAPKQTKDQLIIEVPGRLQIKAFQSASGAYMGLFMSGSAGWATASVSCSVYDSTWHHIALTRDDLDDNPSTAIQNYVLSIRKTNYEKVVATYTASLSFTSTNAVSQSYNSRFVTASQLYIPQQTVPTPGSRRTALIFTGSIQEFRYWSTKLQDSILDNHALAPTSFQGNLTDTHTGSTSSFYDLCFRLSLGADNNKVNFAATTTSISQHPNQYTASFAGTTIARSTGSYSNGFSSSFYTPGSTTGSGYFPNVEMHSLEWPDLGGNRSISNKIRIDDGILLADEDQLFRNNSIQRSLSDNQPIDSARLGVYFSPTNEVNQDIAEQFGGISIDDYIGDPSQLTMDHYPDLENLYREYSKKYTKRNNAQNYIRLIRYFDSALFQMIKRFVPYRANTQVGLVIEPHLLQRSKVPVAQPSYTPEHYSSSLDLSLYYEKPNGFVQDGDGEPFRDGPYYVQAGTIGGDESDYIRFNGEQHGVAEYNDKVVDNGVAYMAPRNGIDLDPKVVNPMKYDMVVLDGNNIVRPIEASGTANEFSRTQLAEHLSDNGADSLYETINTGLTSYGIDRNIEGSQYKFIGTRQIQDPSPNFGTNLLPASQVITGWAANSPAAPGTFSITSSYSGSTNGLAPDNTYTATLFNIQATGAPGYYINSATTLQSGKYYAFDLYFKVSSSVAGAVDISSTNFIVRVGGDNTQVEFSDVGLNGNFTPYGSPTSPIVNQKFLSDPTGWKYARIVYKCTTTGTQNMTVYAGAASANTSSVLIWRPRLYEFPANFVTGSGFESYESSRYDYSEIFPPVVYDSRYSQAANNASGQYDVDIYGGKAFQKSLMSDGSSGGYLWDDNIRLNICGWTANYGLTLDTIYFGTILRSPVTSSTTLSGRSVGWGQYPATSPTEYSKWYIDQPGGAISGRYGLINQLFHDTGNTNNLPSTASIKIPAFYWDDLNRRAEYRYEVIIQDYWVQSGTGGACRIELHYGDLDCGLTGSYTAIENTSTTRTYQTLAKGPWLGIRVFSSFTAAQSNKVLEYVLQNLKVKCLNYRAQTQDYHLRNSSGMTNARYNGCKMTSTDWNIDSPDTSDGGPVVSITVGGGNQLSNVKPGIRGNYEII